MAKNTQSNFRQAWNIIIVISIIVAGVVSWFNYTRTPGYSTASLVYAAGAAVALAIALALILLEGAKRFSGGLGDVLKLGHISESPFLKVFQNPVVAWLIILGYTAVVFLAASSGLQVWGDPGVYTSVESFSSGGESLAASEFGLFQSVFDIAFVPAIVEDVVSYGISVAFMMLFALMLFFARVITNKAVYKWNAAWYVFGVIISSASAALIFSKAHGVVAGGNTSFFLAAWLFQTFNLIIFWLTGFVAPIAHFVHNGFYAIGFSVAVALILIPMRIKKKQKLGDKE